MLSVQGSWITTKSGTVQHFATEVELLRHDISANGTKTYLRKSEDTPNQPKPVDFNFIGYFETVELSAV